ncbi:MAG: glycosyltransferase family 39 protein [Phycisphaerales bacterium]|nr:glycosyltransferase family 39 protein [Phycisphaerales bacterium]
MDEAVSPPTTPAAQPRFDWRFVAVLVVAGALLVLFRLHAFGVPLETDECNYAYIGERLLHGDRLYVDVWDHQPPGVFVLFAGVIGVFGDAPVVFRLMATAFSLASFVLIVLIANRYGGRRAALIAGLLFALVSSDPGTAGEGCNREIYMNTLLLAAWWLASGPKVGSRFRLFAAGGMLGLASALKTIIAVHWVFLAVWIAWAAWREHRRAWPAVRALLILGMGPALLWISIGAYFGLTSRWSEFTDATFAFNLSYAKSDAPFAARFLQFFAPPRHPFTFDSALPLWIAGILAVGVHAVLAIIDRHRDRAGPLLAYVLASYVAVCLPAHFWPHYYYLMIPPLALLIGSAIEDLGALRWRAARPSAVVVAGLVVLAVGLTEWAWYLGQPPFGITVARYNSRDFWGRAIGEKVRAVTDPDDYVFVYGNDAEIYYYAQRRCASRFTMISGLAEGSRGADSAAPC